MKPEVTAIIVVRKGSVRIPSKNLLPLGNENLLTRKIRQLKTCQTISRVVVGSDSDEMLKVALDAGAEIIRRPDYFCDEQKASANDMIANMCSLLGKTDIVVWAHCTNPLLSSETYNEAVRTFLENQDNYDSLLSVVKFQEHLWGGGIRNHSITIHMLNAIFRPENYLLIICKMEVYSFNHTNKCPKIIIFSEKSLICLRFQRTNF